MQESSFSTIYRIVIFIGISYFTLYMYIDYSHMWVKVGYGRTLFNDLIFYKEIPFAILISSFVFFPGIRNRWIRVLLPVVPVISLYFLFDGFYNTFNRSPFPSDFQNLWLVFEYSFFIAISICLLLFLIPVCVAGNVFFAFHSYSNPIFKRTILIRLLTFAFFITFVNSETFNKLNQQSFNYTVWTAEDTIRENGKLFSFIYYANQEIKNQQRLVNLSPLVEAVDIAKRLYPGKVNKSRNIHVIVLESFIDPRLIEPLKLGNEVLAEEILPFLNDKEHFSHVISPIYGGGTAQAEFELLTGLPALSKVNQIEFNVMKGSPMSSFVNQLNQSNFHTMATIAPSSIYFNAKQAYKSIGFSEIQFLEDEREKKGLPDNGPLFDGDLLSYNLSKVESAIRENKGPIFNYVLGMYGHVPFSRDKVNRPDIIDVKHSDDRLSRISNQFYYRTKAVGQFLKELIALDQDAVIVVISDHLPSIFNRKLRYQLDNKINIALLINKGKTIDITGKKLYQIPWLIWDLIANNNQEISRNIAQDEMEILYYRALFESLR